MFPRKMSPTRLARQEERSPVEIAAPRKHSRLHGVHVTYHFLVLIGLFLWLRLRGSSSRHEYGRRVREFLERMGALWIRAGQILSLRSDVFSAEFCEELSQLRDRGTGIPFATAKAIVEEELQAPLEKIFDEFEPQPFDATTIGQVHMAHLRRENAWVAVNVQQPHAAAMFRRDAALIRRILVVLQSLSIRRDMCWHDFVLELNALMTRELDYRYESSNLRKLRKNLRKHGVYIHRAMRRYSSRRVFVTEFIQGALMSDYVQLQQSDPARLASWVNANNINPRKLAQCLFRSAFRQVFEDNFFQADMHPENIILLRDSRFSILDTRNVGSLENENLAKHRLLFEAIAQQDYTMAADLYLFLATSLPMVDIEEVKLQLVRTFRLWETRTHIRSLPFRDKSISRLMHDLNEITHRYGFQTQWSLSRLARTWVNLDASLECLWPEMNYFAEMRDYFRRARRRGNRAIVQNAPAYFAQNLFSAAELPKAFEERQIFRQSIVRRQARAFQGSASKLACTLATAFSLGALIFLLTTLVLLSALAQQKYRLPVEDILGTQWSQGLQRLPDVGHGFGLGLVLFSFCLFLIARRAKHYFRQADVRVPEAKAAI